jgi:hypothetical protein
VSHANLTAIGGVQVLCVEWNPFKARINDSVPHTKAAHPNRCRTPT